MSSKGSEHIQRISFAALRAAIAILSLASLPLSAQAASEPVARTLPSSGPIQGPGVGTARWLPTLKVERLDGSKLVYGPHSVGASEGFETLTELPPPLETGVGEGKLLAVIPSGGSTLESTGQAPWVLLTGKPCAGVTGPSCEEEKGVFAMRATGGRRHQFTFPGKIIDPKTGGKIFESRAFFGRCLSSGKPVYISFQREKVDRRNRLASSVYVGEFGSDMLDEQLISRGFPSLQTTLRKVRSGECTEIDGRNRMASSKMMNLRPSREEDEDEEADDEGEEDLNSKLPGASTGKNGEPESFDSPFDGAGGKSEPKPVLTSPGARMAAPFEWGKNGARRR